MKIGSTFTGAGGLDMAVQRLWPDATFAWFSENDSHSAAVSQHHHPGVPNLGDIRQIDWDDVEPVDVIVGGFPCQDISHAGKGAGITKETRSGLWFELLDSALSLRPRLLLLENVSGILTRGVGVVFGSLAEVGWDAEWTCLRASDVGAPHRRDRWFAVCWPAADSIGGGHGPGEDIGRVGPVDRPDTEGARQRQWTRQIVGRGGETAGVKLLPTPRSANADGRNDSVWERPASQPQNLENALYRPHKDRNWGEYARAIRLWEQTLGRPAPNPTDEQGRLSAYFVEWMMGWPSGWTDVAGTSRTQRLKMCGNGVVPRQAEHAYRHLLARVEEPAHV